MQFCGQLGIVQATHAGIEIRWFVNAAARAPLGGNPQPALLPERRTLPAASPAEAAPSASLGVIPAVASLDEASFADPLAASPLEGPPLLPLPDATPTPTPDVDWLDEPELEDAPPLAIEPAPDAVLDPAPAAPPPPAPVVPFSAGPEPVWLALQAATAKTPQYNPRRKDARLTPVSVEARVTFDHPGASAATPER